MPWFFRPLTLHHLLLALMFSSILFSWPTIVSQLPELVCQLLIVVSFNVDMVSLFCEQQEEVIKFIQGPEMINLVQTSFVNVTTGRWGESRRAKDNVSDLDYRLARIPVNPSLFSLNQLSKEPFYHIS